MDSDIRPISPAEAIIARSKNFSDKAIEAFNELIVKNFANNHSVVTFKSVVALMREMGTNVEAVYSNDWLRVEDAYRAQGWKVKYSEPDHGEKFDSYFDFSL